MLVVIAILMAIVIVLILTMIASVYQMDRDFRRKMADLHRKQELTEHAVEHLERKIINMEAEDDQHNMQN